MNQNLAEAERWLAQAEQDIKSAEWDVKGGFHESACFKTQQAAEKGLKAVSLSLGKSGVTSHSTFALARELAKTDRSFESVSSACRELDKLYIPTRYPDALPSGIPHDYFTKDDAEKAIKHCKQILSTASGAIAKKEKEALGKKK
ncbi:MAG: HEPN domain-containing protein [Nanoarchaeota archaeon]